MNLEQALAAVSLVGAVISTTATVYFWLVRANSERPNLKCALADREMFLGSGAERRQIGLKLGLIVINSSTLPNSVLEVRAWVRLRDGEWLEVEKLSFDKATPRPVNLPALQTGLLTVTGMISFPSVADLEQGGGNKTLAAYAERFLTNPREIRVELKGVTEERFLSVVSYQAS